VSKKLLSSEIKKLLIEYKIATFEEIIGCNQEEINKLEKSTFLELPQIYKEFLLACGHKAGKLFKGSNVFYKDLFDLTEDGRDILSSDNSPFKLPRKAFVFSIHQGYEFWYFNSDSNPDPSVYFYSESFKINTKNDELKPIKYFDSYSKFLIFSLESSRRMQEELKRLDIEIKKNKAD